LISSSPETLKQLDLSKRKSVKNRKKLARKRLLKTKKKKFRLGELNNHSRIGDLDSLLTTIHNKVEKYFTNRLITKPIIMCQFEE
jgi:hypothetical protein